MEIELADERIMEEGLAEKTDAVAAAARDLEECIKKKIQFHTPLAADMTRLLDTGFDGPEAIHWSRLIYLPLPKISERTVSSKVQKWVQLSDFEMALDEQREKIKNIAVKRCPIQRCNASFIDEWSHRWDFHPDSSNRHWAPGPEPLKFLETNEQIMPLVESSDTRWQDAHVRETKEETEKDTFEPAMEKQEESSDPFHIEESEPEHLKTIGQTMALVESSGLRCQDLHARNIEEEREADIFELTKNPDLKYQMSQVRKFEEKTEIVRPEPEMKKKKGFVGSLSMKNQQ